MPIVGGEPVTALPVKRCPVCGRKVKLIKEPCVRKVATQKSSMRNLLDFTPNGFRKSCMFSWHPGKLLRPIFTIVGYFAKLIKDTFISHKAVGNPNLLYGNT